MSAATHLDGKLNELQPEVVQKTVNHLDVCHWINLRRVWLQSSKASPLYEHILDCLERLALRQMVLRPPSTQIFAELMKQLDPRPRAATANLMDVFSQGISRMRFEEASAQQCFGSKSRDGGDVGKPEKLTADFGSASADSDSRPQPLLGTQRRAKGAAP